ncbi:baseplate J/gp47 family protein [Paenibacillus endoradicis]|uniref:baseplate J/gp47 family protein n=1 Tax=Paenibacillus endoradicis TaxID=2972487 RepID=UPI002158E318|nr:baseplate J/gp47 family protein [Paenibacillus endoradicis]MCR8657442.1 baseplate J/gp47 family protein [Paenibacillus endoradicis]
MLPIPNLDDRSFEQLVREARDLIPRIAPDWTDENAHDPGITLLEMLAWHLEMQQYELDSLSVTHELKFLKLLGGMPRHRMPATTSLSFSHASKQTYIPLGTQLKVGQLVFETVRSINIIPDISQKITLYRMDDIHHLSQDMTTGRSVIYPFGEHAQQDATMELKLAEPLPRQMPLSLWIELDRQEPTIRIPARYKNFTPSAYVQWSYLDEDEHGDSWKPVRMERDESYCMHQSGPILFEIPVGSSKVTALRAKLLSGSFDDVPRIRRLVWNEVFATQGQTWCMEQTFEGWSEQDMMIGQIDPIHVYLYHALFMEGHIQVQYFVHNGWIDISSNGYELVHDASHLKIILLPSSLVPVGTNSIRIVAVQPEFIAQQYIAAGNGISFQKYDLPIPSVFSNQVRLQVGAYSAKLGCMLWEDWDSVLDFDDSNTYSRHYILSNDESQIQFSDGIHGISPPASTSRNIRFISYRTGVGSAGNVKEDTIREMVLRKNALRLTNLFPAYGGTEEESVSEALDRIKLEVLEPKCGITTADIEQRVLEIPGIRIARIRAIAGYHTRLNNYPNERAMGHISVVVVPESSRSFPIPSEGLRLTIATHLEPYRLLTSQFHIIAPEYIKVTIRAIIVVTPQYEGKEHDVIQALNGWLKPETSVHSEGWEFGRAIYKSDVYDMIHTVAGVQYIQDVWLMAEGNNVYQDEGGDIIIPPNGLAYSGGHDVEFVLTNN